MISNFGLLEDENRPFRTQKSKGLQQISEDTVNENDASSNSFQSDEEDESSESQSSEQSS